MWSFIKYGSSNLYLTIARLFETFMFRWMSSSFLNTVSLKAFTARCSASKTRQKVWIAVKGPAKGRRGRGKSRNSDAEGWRTKKRGEGRRKHLDRLKQFRCWPNFERLLCVPSIASATAGKSAHSKLFFPLAISWLSWSIVFQQPTNLWKFELTNFFNSSCLFFNFSSRFFQERWVTKTMKTIYRFAFHQLSKSGLLLCQSQVLCGIEGFRCEHVGTWVVSEGQWVTNQCSNLWVVSELRLQTCHPTKYQEGQEHHQSHLSLSKLVMFRPARTSFFVQHNDSPSSSNPCSITSAQVVG